MASQPAWCSIDGCRKKPSGLKFSTHRTKQKACSCSDTSLARFLAFVGSPFLFRFRKRHVVPTSWVRRLVRLSKVG